ncbi:MAG: ISAs1 family transposase [Duodenibacillus sp.]|nr:ISAs1 family transposase [Duodenibacillus sp.]
MPRGRPRTHEGKEYKTITRRKRKDGNFDVIEVTSKYDPEAQNNRPVSSRKLGVLLAGYQDADKEMIRMGTPEMAEFTRKARMRRWPGKATPEPPEAPAALACGAALIPDERQEGKVEFPLQIVVMVLILAAMAGVTSTYKAAEFWKTFRPVFEVIFPGFPSEDISHDTVRRVTQLLGRADNEKFLRTLTQPLIREGKRRRHIAIDGQAVSAAEIDGVRPFIFTAYDCVNRLTITQRLIQAKKNEISEAVSLILPLDLRGCILTADAMNTQKAFTQTLVLEKKCDYMLALKRNHLNLYDSVKARFELEPPDGLHGGRPALKTWKSKKHSSCEKGHGRVEQRFVRVLPASMLHGDDLAGWEGLADGIIVEAVTERFFPKTGETTKEARYFISSLSPEGEGIAEEAAEAIRNHWCIENEQHWVLDTTFQQDKTQCRNADFLAGRSLILKAANNFLSAIQDSETKDPEERPSKECLKVRCMDIRRTWDVLCEILG